MTDYSEQVFSAWQFWWVPTNVIIGASNLLQFSERWRCDVIWPSDWELEWCLYGWFPHGPSFHDSHSCSLKWKVPRILSYLLIWEVCRVSFTQQSNSWWKVPILCKCNTWKSNLQWIYPKLVEAILCLHQITQLLLFHCWERTWVFRVRFICWYIQSFVII